MNHDETQILEALGAWQVETTDLTARVASAVSTTPDLLVELRAMRRELSELRRTTTELKSEIVHLRADLAHRQPVRLAPFSPSESLARLS